jgi:hypothetical protein
VFHLLEDEQLWYHCLELNDGPPTWNWFTQLINSHFSLPHHELALLRHDGSVDDFAKCFMALSCRGPDITKTQQVQLFIAGLDKPSH